MCDRCIFGWPPLLPARPAKCAWCGVPLGEERFYDYMLEGAFCTETCTEYAEDEYFAECEEL